MASSATPSQSRPLDLRAPAPGSPGLAEPRATSALISPALLGRSEAGLDWTPELVEARIRDGGPAFAWLSPEGELVAGFGSAARFEASGTGRFEAAKQWLKGLEDQAAPASGGGRPRLFAVGGFSFSEASAGAPAGLGDAVFFVPNEVWHTIPGGHTHRTVWTRGESREAPWIPPREWKRARLPEWSQSEWSSAVRRILDAIRDGSVEKAVLARAEEIDAPGPYDPALVFWKLLEANPQCFRFLVRPSGGAAFVGASPERLVALRGGRVASDAVAGTAQDAALLESAKDRDEHAFVVRHILESLAPLCASIEADREPALQRHRHLAHLRTRIQGLARPRVHVLDLLARVHPTPAVAGTPRDQALELLRACEPSHRGWYAGAVGWMDAEGEGDFAVGIRSALIEGERAILFAGAGIVAGSDPEAEWAETEVKLSVMREAIADAGR